MEPMYYVILTDTESGVIDSSANNNILSVRDVVDVYDQRRTKTCMVRDVVDVYGQRRS